MRCEVAREELQLGRQSAELQAHVQSCESCGALAQQHKALDAMLALDEPHRPGPGFDTRFFARLDEERATSRKKNKWMWLWALVPAAAGVALFVLKPSETVAPPPEAALIEAIAEPDDLALLQDLELLEDIEVVEQLDELEDLDLLEGVDPAELDRIAAEAAP